MAWSVLLMLASIIDLSAQDDASLPSRISTLVGSGITLNTFDRPSGLAVDGNGNIYVPDTSRIWKITPAGVVSKLAGGTGLYEEGGSTSTDGTGSSARFRDPHGVAVDGNGNVYVADSGNHKIRKVTPAGVVTTVAGSGMQGNTDGSRGTASFSYPAGVAVDGSGNIYVADIGNHKIRKISPGGAVTTLAGSGIASGQDGVGAEASFNSPIGVAVDGSGNVYVGDELNHKVRKITPTGVVTTLAGGINVWTGDLASFRNPRGVAVDSTGNVYVADRGNHTIRKVTPAGVVTTVAGSSPVQGDMDGTGAAARFRFPEGVAAGPDGTIYIADTGNGSIRKGVPRVAQSISSFPSLPPRTYGDAAFDVVAMASSGLAVTISIVSGPATVSGNTITLTGAGTVILSASQAGNATFAPATSLERSFLVSKSGQTISYPGFTTLPFSNTPYSLPATSSSKLPVVYTLLSGSATLNGSLLKVNGTGSVKLRVSQAGNSNFLAAPSVEVILTIVQNAGTPSNIQLSSSWLFEAANDVGQFSALDTDPGDVITYTLVSGAGDADNAKFSIIGETLGLNVPNSVNKDIQRSVSIRVRATDLAGQVFEKILTLMVVDSNPHAVFRPKGASTTAPCYVNTIFHLTDARGRGINLPKALIEQDKGLFSVIDNDGDPLNAINVRNSEEAFAQISKLDSVPTTVKTVLVIDQSQSIGLANLAKAREAAKALVDSMFPQQEIAVYAFSETAVLKKGFSRDKTALKAAIDSISGLSGTTTDLNGTIHNLLSPLFRNPDSSTSPNATYWSEAFNKQGVNTGFLVVFTDGDDQAARRSIGEVQSIRNSTGKTVHIVGLLKSTESEGNKQNFRDKWAQLANGLAVSVDNVDDLGAKFREVQDDMQNSADSYYWVNYASPRRSANRSFTVTLRNNSNTEASGRLTTNYDASSFFSLQAGVFINRSVSGDVATSLTVARGSTVTVSASSLFGDAASYEWSLSDPSLGTVVPIDANASRASLTVADFNATTTLKVRDTVNSYTRTIPLIIGSGLTSLSSLGIIGSTLSPAFTPDTTNYTASVANATKSLKVSPSATGAFTIKVNGTTVASGSTSPAIPLKVGPNLISVVITDPGGTDSKIYKVTVTRAASSVSTLSKLVIKGAKLSPAFNSAALKYRGKVTKSVKSVTVTPTTSSPVAKITVNGFAVKSGTASKAIALKNGKNVISVTVTAENGSKKTYKITVTRAAASISPTGSGAGLAAVRLIPSEHLPLTTIARILIDGSSYLQISVSRQIGDELTPRVEVSSNLMDWYSGENYTTTLVDSPDLLKVRDDTPMTKDRKRYIRVTYKE